MNGNPFKKKRVSSKSYELQIDKDTEKLAQIVEKLSVDELIDSNNEITENLLKVEEEFKVINDRNSQISNLIKSQQKTIECLNVDNSYLNDLLDKTRQAARKHKRKKEIKESDIISETFKSIEQQNINLQKSLDSINETDDFSQIKQRKSNMQNSIDMLSNFQMISKRRENILQNYSAYKTEFFNHTKRNELKQQLDQISDENNRLRSLLDKRIKQQNCLKLENEKLNEVNKSLDEIYSIEAETKRIQKEIDSCQSQSDFSQFLHIDAQNSSQFDLFSSQPFYISVETMTDGTPLLNEDDRQISKKIKDIDTEISIIKQDDQFKRDKLADIWMKTKRIKQEEMKEFDLTEQYFLSHT